MHLANARDCSTADRHRQTHGLCGASIRRPTVPGTEHPAADAAALPHWHGTSTLDSAHSQRLAHTGRGDWAEPIVPWKVIRLLHGEPASLLDTGQVSPRIILLPSPPCFARTGRTCYNARKFGICTHRASSLSGDVANPTTRWQLAHHADGSLRDVRMFARRKHSMSTPWAAQSSAHLLSHVAVRLDAGCVPGGDFDCRSENRLADRAASS
jgi:hypothetical protein